jgi:hypothetical protein
MWNDDDAAAGLPGLCDDLGLFNRWFVVVLISERVGVTLRHEPAIGLVNDAMGGEPAALYRFGAEDDDIALLNCAGGLYRDSEKAIAWFESGRHTIRLDVREAGGGAQGLTENEQKNKEHNGEFDDDRDRSAN